MTDAQEIHREKLAYSAGKLVELLALNAPAQIVCGQVVQIFNQTLLAYDAALYAELGKRARETKLAANGYCVKCERPFERQGEASDHCPACLAEFETEDWSPSQN